MEQQNSAKFAFLYMLSLVALVFMAISTGVIVFQIINKEIIDVAHMSLGDGFDQVAIKFAISAIIVSAPIFYVTASLINKNLISGALTKDSGVRRWLTYFILFIASVIMIGWFISIINSFLNGEITANFILKSLTAIVIAAIIFSYYLYDIRRQIVPGEKNKITRAYFFGSIILVLAVFISAFFFIDSPKTVRDRNADNAILQKFDQISMAINNYYTTNKRLPGGLNDLLGGNFYLTADDFKNTSTGKNFDYKITGKSSYELCTDFLTSNKNDASNYYESARWPHDRSYQCLSQKMGMGLTPPIPMQK